MEGAEKAWGGERFCNIKEEIHKYGNLTRFICLKSSKNMVELGAWDASVQELAPDLLSFLIGEY